MQNTLVKIHIVLGLIDLDLQGQIEIKKFKFHYAWFCPPE